MRIISCIILCLAFACQSAYSQNVNIRGTVPTAKDSTEIWFSRSIDGHPSNFCFMYDNAIVHNKAFTKSFNISQTNIITITPNKYVPKVYLICSPGDEIKLEYSQNINHQLSVEYRGNNAQGQKILNASPVFSIPLIRNLLDSLLLLNQDEQSTPPEILEQLENQKITLLQPISDLLAKKKITKSFYKLAILEANAKFLCALDNLISGYLLNKSILNVSKKLTEANLLAIQKFLYVKYDPFLDEYQNVSGDLAFLNCESKCKLIEKGILQGNRTDWGLWIKPYKKSNSFAPIAIQHNMLAMDLVFNRKFKDQDIKIDSLSFIVFKEKFPKSPFIPVLEWYFQKEVTNEKILSYSYGNYNRQVNKMDLTGNKQYTSLQEILSDKFSGKPVFVDLWASYCGPCKEEFRNDDSLATFLRQHNVELLYVSLDFPSAGNLWIKDVKDYNLNGAHYFATLSLIPSIETLIKEKNFGIPRYLLFDGKGHLIDGNLPKPSQSREYYSKVFSKFTQ